VLAVCDNEKCLVSGILLIGAAVRCVLLTIISF
jgi:hypothetical protein